MSESHSERASLLPPHAELARYLPVRALGTGGMAETFIARSVDPRRTELVCLKRIRRALASDPAQRAHFADEARVLSRLCHPNVLAVLDAGTDLEGPFLVTELVEGLDLRRLLAWLTDLGEPMPERVALRIAHDLGEALAHAHAHGVLHRDVTPANVLLGRDGRVVLIDFGIARSEAQTQRTRTGLVKGKAAYMAPEQALGRTLDARTDLFALGVVLFEMLAGRRPHDGASDVETVTNALRGQRRMLQRPLETVGLEALIDSLLRAQPSLRPEHATQFVRALEGAPMASAAELAAWVRTACETPGPGERALRDETRKGARMKRPETLTVPEHAIHTSLQPAYEPARPAPPPELDPPTTLDTAWPTEPGGHGETMVMPRLEAEDAHEDPAATEVSGLEKTTAAARGERDRETLLVPASPPRPAPHTARPRRVARFLRAGMTLAAGLVAGALTGGLVAVVLRCAT